MPIHKTVLKPTRFGAVLCCLKTGRSLTSRPIAARKNKRRSIRSDRSRSGRDSIHRPLRADFLLGGHLWHFSTVQSAYCRRSSSLSVPVSVSGALSTCSKATATITPVPMLMYGKEASNRKQEIDRQHYTIPNQRPKDKHCGKI